MPHNKELHRNVTSNMHEKLKHHIDANQILVHILLANNLIRRQDLGELIDFEERNLFTWSNRGQMLCRFKNFNPIIKKEVLFNAFNDAPLPKREEKREARLSAGQGAV